MKIFTDHPFRARADEPLYQQLYTHLRTAILAGRLPGGTKLPSTRALADELRVSRNTILNTYAQLTAEGYIESVEGSGTFVADVLPERLLTTPEGFVHAAPEPCSSEMHQPNLSRRATAQLTSRQIPPVLPPAANGRPFHLGMSTFDTFPYQLWSRLVARRARRMSIGAITYQDPAGYKPLREAIASHLTISRRVRCTPEQLVIVTVRRLIDFHMPILEQAALADFIAEGHFTRHLRRMRMLLAERRTAMLEALRSVPLDIYASPAGSHCIGWLPAGMDSLQLIHQATAHDLNLWLVSQYSIEPLARDGLVLGYGVHNEEEMKGLSTGWRKLCSWFGQRRKTSTDKEKHDEKSILTLCHDP